MNVLRQKGERLLLLVLLALVCAFAGQKTVMAASVTGEKTVYIGEKTTLTAAEFPEGAEVSWTSSDESIVSVSADTGESVEAEAAGFGKATVTASAVSGGETVTASIKITTKLAAPELDTLTAVGVKTMKLTWKKVSGAEGYIVYRKTGKGTWKKLKKLTDADTVSYSDGTCERNNTYTYTVRAYAYNNATKKTGYSDYAANELKGKTKSFAPEMKSAEVTSSTSIKVKWKSVPDADSYILYRKVKGSSDWERVGTTTKTTLSDKKAACGTTYIYTVRAVSGTEKSAYDKTGVTCTATPPQPELVSLTTKGKKKLLLTWESVEGADGYRVYRKNSEGKWKALATVKDGTSYLDTTVEYKKDYTYTVKAYTKVNKKKVWGEYNKTGITGSTQTKSKVIEGLKSPKLSGAVGSSYNSITISWEAVSGVDGYSVYRLTEKNTWTRLADVEGAGTLSYEDKTCTFGTKYTYTVLSYVNYDGKPARSEDWDDAGVSAKPVLAAPELKSASATGLKQIKVTWGSVKGADGYTIYRKTKSSGWKKLKNLTGTSYTDTTIKNNVTYYYTVRAYIKVTSSGKTSAVRGKYDKNGISAQAKITSKYKNGLKLYYDSNGNLIKDVESIIGKQDSYLIKVNKQRNTVTVYAKDDNGKYVVPVKAFVCSTGSATPVGTFTTPAKYRWHELMGPCWGQWCTRIHGGVLFHSVYYMTYNDNTDLSVKAYNKLGTQCSHGCVRLAAGDAKWIYDNCKLGTTVTVYNSSNAGPFGKPTPYTLATNHRWDPTDPNVQYLCKKNGCHNYE